MAESIDIRSVEPNAWDKLLEQFLDRTVFHTLPWLQTISATNGAKIVLASAWQAKQCVGVWPVLELWKARLLRIIGSPLPGWSTAYMGPLIAPAADVHHTVQSFLQHKLLGGRCYAYFACRVVDRFRPVDLSPFGFSIVRKFETFRIDLTQSEDTIWSNLKSECRTRIRRAEKLGAEVRCETTSAFINDYWAMSLETFAKAGIQPTHSRQFLEELWKRSHSSNKLFALSAFCDGRRIGSLILPFDDHTMYYWGGAAFMQHREIPSHNLLHWHAMRHAKRLGLREYDFISSEGGPGRFKSTFGPETVAMSTYWERSPSRLMTFLKRHYEQLARKRRRTAPSPEC